MTIHLKDLTVSEVELPLEDHRLVFGGEGLPDVYGLPTGYRRRTGCDGRDPIGSDEILIETDWGW